MSTQATRAGVILSILGALKPGLSQLPMEDDVPRLWPQPAEVDLGEPGAADLTLDEKLFQIVSQRLARHICTLESAIEPCS